MAVDAAAVVVVAAAVAMDPEVIAREKKKEAPGAPTREEKEQAEDLGRETTTSMSMALPGRARGRWGVLPGARESE